VTTLRSLFLAHAGNLDRQFCVAQALLYLGQAEPVHQDLYEEHKRSGLIQRLPRSTSPVGAA